MQGLPKQRGGEVYYDVETEAFAGYMEEIKEEAPHRSEDAAEPHRHISRR